MNQQANPVKDKTDAEVAAENRKRVLGARRESEIDYLKETGELHPASKCEVFEVIMQSYFAKEYREAVDAKKKELLAEPE